MRLLARLIYYVISIKENAKLNSNQIPQKLPVKTFCWLSPPNALTIWGMPRMGLKEPIWHLELPAYQILWKWLDIWPFISKNPDFILIPSTKCFKSKSLQRTSLLNPYYNNQSIGNPWPVVVILSEKFPYQIFQCLQQW